MVAPAGLQLGFSRAEDGCLCSPDDLVLKAGLQQHIKGAIHFTSPSSIGSQGGNGSNYCIKGFTLGEHGINCSEQDIKVSSDGTHGFNMVEDPEGNMEEFGPGEKDTALLQQPTTETDKGPQSEGMVLQLTEARESVADVSMKVGYTSTGRRVQWNDNYGKELVHVFEYEVSDTEDSEEDDDDTHTCACNIQ